MRRFLPVALSALVCACADVRLVGGPCGGNQFASAMVVLPDTGINAARDIKVVFLQHDVSELSEISIEQPWPENAPSDSEPNPRVRLVSASGQILLDTLGTRYDRGVGGFTDPTWYIAHWIKDAPTRNAFYNAFAADSLWLELWHTTAPGPGTRVMLNTTSFGINPRSTCD